MKCTGYMLYLLGSCIPEDNNILNAKAPRVSQILQKLYQK